MILGRRPVAVTEPLTAEHAEIAEGHKILCVLGALGGKELLDSTLWRHRFGGSSRFGNFATIV